MTLEPAPVAVRACENCDEPVVLDRRNEWVHLYGEVITCVWPKAAWWRRALGRD